MADLEVARRWYEDQRPGLSSDLVNEFEKAARDLASQGERFPLYFEGFRRALLARFPYKIFFVINGDKIVIARFLHEKQDHPRFLRR